MVTKRTPIARAIKSRIGPETVSLYRQLRAIYDGGDEDAWRDASELRARLNRLLGRSDPWLNSIFWTISNDECAHPQGSAAHDDWPLAVATRKALDEAAERMTT